MVQSEDRWEGKPLILEPWQYQMLGEALAFDKSGKATWRSVVIIAPRKNGKTALLSALALYRLLTSDGRPEVLLAASSDKQAGRLFDAAARFVRRSPVLSQLLRVRDHEGEIVREDGMGIIYRLSSDPKRLHGYNPTDVIADELAQWLTPTLRRAFAAVTSAGGARSAPQVFTITTAGEASQRKDSILGRILDAAATAHDINRRPGLTIYRHTGAATLVWEYTAPTKDPRDIKAMKLANPASWITEAYLRRQAEDPELTDAEVLQLHGCVWAETDTTWIAPEYWESRRTNRKLQDGEELVLGFDGSYSRDATALVAATLDGFVAPIRVWERPEGAPSDWKVPREEVEAEVERAMERFKVLELACDPPGWHAEIDRWVETYGDEMVVMYETNLRKRMAPACDRFRVGVLEGDLTHNGSSVLARHIGHCVAKDTPQGIVITKDRADSPHKIDAAVAAIVAYDRSCWHRDQVREPYAAWA
jgi:phage terminase large subunit-like protein